MTIQIKISIARLQKGVKTVAKHKNRNLAPTPAYEDAGLFKNKVCEVVVNLVPIFARNSREDIVVAGYVGGNLDISVVFAGRRIPQARTLILTLKAKKTAVLQHALAAHLPPVNLATIRHPIRIEGAWRPRFTTDPEGWEKRSYHFMAARWSFRDLEGNSVQSGSVPELGIPTVETASL